MEVLKLIKWATIILLIFISACFAWPFFAIAARLDRKECDQFINNFGSILAGKIKSDFK